MITTLTLLVTALQLKLALLGLPSQYKEFVDTNMPIVEQAIILAQTEMSTPQPTVQTNQTAQTQTTQTNQTNQQLSTNNQSVQAPIFGSTPQIINNQTNMEIVLKDENGSVYSDAVSIQSGSVVKLFINADVLSNGKSQLVTIVMTSSDGQSRTQDKNERACSQRVVGGPRDDCSITFVYRVPEPGTYTVTFTSGELTKTLTVNAQ